MRITLADLKSLASTNPDLQRGCVVDTNALFAAVIPPDRLNAWAEATFIQLNALGLPAFTNINIRSEFLDLQRRVLIPEGLVSLYDSPISPNFAPAVQTQLRSLKTLMRRATEEGRLYKFNDQQVKRYRDLLVEYGEFETWEDFCRDFVHPYIVTAWDDMVSALNLQFVGTRGIESREYFESDPRWKGVADIMGRFGIGSADAMIINFFLCSKFSLIVTGDEDVAYVVERLSDGTKYVLVPEDEEELLK